MKVAEDCEKVSRQIQILRDTNLFGKTFITENRVETWSFSLKNKHPIPVCIVLDTKR